MVHTQESTYKAIDYIARSILYLHSLTHAWQCGRPWTRSNVHATSCSTPSKLSHESEGSRVRSVVPRIAPSTLRRFPMLHIVSPSNRPTNDADPHGSSGMRTWLLLYGRCPCSLPRRDYRLIRGPHLRFLFRAVPSRSFLRGVCPSRRAVWGPPMVLSRRIKLPAGGRSWKLQYRGTA